MRLILNLVLLLHMAIVTAVGFSFSLMRLAAYSGATFGVSEDPIVILGALLVGFTAGRWWHLLAGGLIVSLAIHLYVVATNELAMGSMWVFWARTSGLLTIAAAANLVRMVFERLMAPDPETPTSTTPE